MIKLLKTLTLRLSAADMTLKWQKCKPAVYVCRLQNQSVYLLNQCVWNRVFIFSIDDSLSDFLSFRWGVSLLGSRQTVTVVSLWPLRISWGPAGHRGTALSSVEGRPRQLCPGMAVWRQHSLPSGLASSRMWREPAGRPHRHAQHHCWELDCFIRRLLLQRYRPIAEQLLAIIMLW